MYRLILALVLLDLAFACHAAVRKNVTEGELVTISLSNKDPNVISVKNDRIERFSAIKGAVISHLDPKQGILTLKPSNAVSDEPFSVLIFTETGKRVTLLVVPAAIPSQDIILIPERSAQSEPIHLKHNMPYTQVAVDLIRCMVNNTVPEDYKRTFLEEAPTPFVQGTILTQSIYQGEYLMGEIISYVYDGKTNTTLSEKLFYVTDVMAIALNKTYVKPGDVVTVFQVKRHG